MTTSNATLAQVRFTAVIAYPGSRPDRTAKVIVESRERRSMPGTMGSTHERPGILV